MTSDLTTLKSGLWDQFNKACAVADNPSNAADNAANRNAAGTIGLAIVAIEKEERERADTLTPLLDKPVVRPAV